MIVGYMCLELLNLVSKGEAGRGFMILSGPFEEAHQRMKVAAVMMSPMIAVLLRALFSSPWAPIRAKFFASSRMPA
jgi:hypothetical protein